MRPRYEMTHSSDFKEVVRARMRATGQPYTATRADLIRERDSAMSPPAADSAAGHEHDGLHGFPSAIAASPAPFSAASVPADAESSSAPSPDVATADRDRAHAEYRRMLGRFLRDGRLMEVPARRRVRVFVLLHLLSLFPAGRTYTEAEVNEILLSVVEDQAFWRRELVEYGYLQREAGVYWLPEQAPERPPHMVQEFPAWESLWLPTHLSDRTA